MQLALNAATREQAALFLAGIIQMIVCPNVLLEKDYHTPMRQRSPGDQIREFMQLEKRFWLNSG
jgi:hypothetical protein